MVLSRNCSLYPALLFSGSKQRPRCLISLSFNFSLFVHFFLSSMTVVVATFSIEVGGDWGMEGVEEVPQICLLSAVFLALPARPVTAPPPHLLYLTSFLCY